MTDSHLTLVNVFGTASTNYFVDTRTWSWYMLLFAPWQAISTALSVPPLPPDLQLLHRTIVFGN